MQVATAHEIDLTDAEGSLLFRPTVELTPAEAQMMRHAFRMLRSKRFRATVRCDACFEAGRGDGMRGEVTSSHIRLECRCRVMTFTGSTL